MRIALLAPTYWPEVRRGTERVIHDLGVALAERNHEVTILTTHPQRRRETIEDGVRVVRDRRLPQPPGLAAHEYHLSTLPTTYLRLIRGDFEIAQAFFPTQAWAAVKARARGGPPVVATTHGIPAREYLVARRNRLEMHLEVCAKAEIVAVLSKAAADPFERYFQRRPMVLPGGVVPADFSYHGGRTAHPSLFCASSLGDPRKRPGLLFRAFERLRDDLPELTLSVARSHDPFMSGATPELPEGAQWLELDGPGEMAAAYGSAWASVNPAIGEAFGLVLVESLAAGTPVVADSSGAGPEIVDDGNGSLFEPDDEDGLVKAVGKALELSQLGETAAKCRARAADFDWRHIVERYEDVYVRAIEGGVS